MIVASVYKLYREDAIGRAKRIHSGLRSIGKIKREDNEREV